MNIEKAIEIWFRPKEVDRTCWIKRRGKIEEVIIYGIRTANGKRVVITQSGNKKPEDLFDSQDGEINEKE